MSSLIFYLLVGTLWLIWLLVAIFEDAERFTFKHGLIITALTLFWPLYVLAEVVLGTAAVVLGIYHLISEIYRHAVKEMGK